MSARQACQRRLDSREDEDDDAYKGASRPARDEDYDDAPERGPRIPHSQSHADPMMDLEAFRTEVHSSQRFMLPRQSVVIGAEDLNEGLGCCGWILTTMSYLIVVLTFPFSFCICLKVVQEYERAVIFRLGRLIGGGARGPGIFFVLPCIESYTKVDLRTVSFDVPPQEVLTKDSVTVSVDAVVYYRVSNATISVANVENAHHSTRSLAQTTLRNVLGTKNLSEILIERDLISGAMQHILDEATEQQWGIKVERVEIKDVRLPVQLQRAMATEAEATREARAKVIAAEGEQRAARALRDAAEIITESPAALQLRYLQTLNSISSEKNSTIIFPFPIDFLKQFIKKVDSGNNSDDSSAPMKAGCGKNSYDNSENEK